MSSSANPMTEVWNKVLFEKFTRFRAVVTVGMSGHSDELLRRRAYSAGSRVLDIGCGFGDTTQKISRLVGPSGSAIGVDCASNFIALCEREAADARIPNASYFVADVQGDDLRGPYDQIFSRFGTMFFTQPVAAFRNIRQALRPGGDLAMIVWRKREDNPWVHEAEVLVKEIIPVAKPEETGQAHPAPGPFSMANADVASDVLRGAGFDRIGFERCDTDVCIGQTVDDAIELAMNMGPAGEIMRLAGEEGTTKRKPQVTDALRALFAPHRRTNGIWFCSSSWFVTARNPG
jgi:ubiquinone/menaquinone biosynthesis C-methylase UbiE